MLFMLLGSVKVIIRLVALVVRANSFERPVDGDGAERPNPARSAAVLMRAEQKEIDGLGVIGIIREAHKLWWTNLKFFCLIQLLLILPLAILAVVGQALWMGGPPDEESPRAPGTGTSGLGLLSFTDRGVDIVSVLMVLIIADTSFSQLAIVSGPLVLLLVVIAILIAIAYEATVSLFSSAIVYAVGIHYGAGQSISFADVLHVSVPRLWMRLTLTNTYYSLLWYSLNAVGIGVIFLLGLNEAPTQFFSLESSISPLVMMAGAVYLDMIFMIAGSVSVLEKDYGWAAVFRSFKLLKGRLLSSLQFQLFWRVPTFVLLAIHNIFEAHITSGAGFRKNMGLIQLTLAALYIWYQTSFWLLKALYTSIQYVTFKTYHDEDVGESMHKLGILRGGYEPLESAIDLEETKEYSRLLIHSNDV